MRNFTLFVTLPSFSSLCCNSKAEVTLTLKNQGEEAYRPKEYGKSIVITRTFNRQGASSWAIKSKDGTKVSDKRDELAAICDHMNIQVDNPLNVLTQGSLAFSSLVRMLTNGEQMLLVNF